MDELNRRAYELDSRGGSGIMLFIAGAVVGAAAALILAPATGRDTRAFIGRNTAVRNDLAKWVPDRARTCRGYGGVFAVGGRIVGHTRIVQAVPSRPLPAPVVPPGAPASVRRVGGCQELRQGMDRDADAPRRRPRRSTFLIAAGQSVEAAKRVPWEGLVG